METTIDKDPFYSANARVSEEARGNDPRLIRALKKKLESELVRSLIDALGDGRERSIRVKFIEPNEDDIFYEQGVLSLKARVLLSYADDAEIGEYVKGFKTSSFDAFLNDPVTEGSVFVSLENTNESIAKASKWHLPYRDEVKASKAKFKHVQGDMFQRVA